MTDNNEITEVDKNNMQCEACVNIGPCTEINGMMLCAVCFENEERITKEFPIPDEFDPDSKESKVTRLVNQLSKEVPLDSRQYFVKEVTNIVDIEVKLKEIEIENPNFELAKIVESRIATFRKNLFELKNQIIELQISSIADQKYLNQIVPQLRAEEREKFKSYDINYKPSEVVKPVAGTSKPRQSASDKAIESFAKMMGITPEQARISMQNAMKNVTGATCTCQATPGLCKVHPK